MSFSELHIGTIKERDSIGDSPSLEKKEPKGYKVILIRPWDLAIYDDEGRK